MVFYDYHDQQRGLTVAGLGDVRQYGMAKEGLIASAEVHVRSGRPPRAVDSSMKCSTATRLRRTPCCPRSPRCSSASRRCSAWCWSPTGTAQPGHQEALKAACLASGKPLEFIVAVPGRRYNEFIDLLEPFHEQCAGATHEVISEHTWNDLRLVVAHDPATAATKTEQRNERIDALIRQADEWSGKLRCCL